MDAKQLEEVGAFIAKMHHDTINEVEAKLNLSGELVESVKSELGDRLESLREYVNSAIEDSCQESSAQHLEEIQKLTEQLKAQEVFEVQLQQRLAEIKDGESIQGPAGMDGQDKPLIEPVELINRTQNDPTCVGVFGQIRQSGDL